METNVLILASNPEGTDKLKLDEEISSIIECLNYSNRKSEYILHHNTGTRISELQRLIIQKRPHILHFCGHGSGHQGLVLENDAGSPQLVETKALTNLLKIFDKRIECVVLNACYTNIQAKQINEHINYVIATKKAIRDDAAILFSKGFYDALFNGETYKDAFELGCNRIHLELYEKNDNQRKLVPVYSEVDQKYVDLPQHEILIFLEKSPLNVIFDKNNLKFNPDNKIIEKKSDEKKDLEIPSKSDELEPKRERNQVFISYSHKDKKWLGDLKTFLAPLMNNQEILTWDDTEIKAGSEWKKEIENALKSAKVAVLMVSPNFLASEFIIKNELPQLLEASQKEGLTILWVHVRNSLYTETEIVIYQAAHNPSKPISAIPKAKRDEVWVEICKKIKEAYNS